MSNPENTFMINNLITKFKNECHADIDVSDSIDTIFEKFVGYLVTCKYASDSRFSIRAISSGQNAGKSGSEMSIDSAAIVINGNVISNVDDLVSVNPNKMNVSYVFTQAKNESYFKEIGGRLLKFITGIQTVLNSSSTDEKLTDALNSFIEVKNVIEGKESIEDDEGERISFTVDGDVSINLYYAISGSEKGKKSSLSGAGDQIDTALSNIREMDGYILKHAEMIGRETLGDLYKDVFESSPVSFNGDTLQVFKAGETSLYGINTIRFGYLPLGEYLKIIQDDRGNIRKNIFDENVRDYLDASRINRSIKKSLDNDFGKDLFFAMNNGVTIISRDTHSAIGSASLMQIKGYQIVNGCQTSNILHEYYSEKSKHLEKLRNELPEIYRKIDPSILENTFFNDIFPSDSDNGDGHVDAEIWNNRSEIKEKIGIIKKFYDDIKNIESSVCVPVRIIDTKKDDVIDLIVESTNTQNSVDKLELISRTQFNKELEAYFEGVNNGSLLYSRRKNQYSGKSDSQIIDSVHLLKAYAAIFSQAPHLSARYLGKLKDSAVKDNPLYFSVEHNHESYYLAARIFTDLTEWLRNERILLKYRRYRWHMIYAFTVYFDRILRDENESGILNSKIKLSQSSTKMKKIVDRYNRLFAEESNPSLNELFSKSRNIVDKSIVAMKKKYQENEINKEPSFSSKIYNLIKEED